MILFFILIRFEPDHSKNFIRFDWQIFHCGTVHISISINYYKTQDSYQKLNVVFIHNMDPQKCFILPIVCQIIWLLCFSTPGDHRLMKVNVYATASNNTSNNNDTEQMACLLKFDVSNDRTWKWKWTWKSFVGWEKRVIISCYKLNLLVTQQIGTKIKSKYDNELEQRLRWENFYDVCLTNKSFMILGSFLLTGMKLTKRIIILS